MYKATLDEIDYPDNDGNPMSDNTLQLDWILRLKANFDILFHADPNVFVAADLLWYPVEGENKIRSAPDAMIVFGRPKGYRGSYKQWDEAGIAPQVVFEILSPGNTVSEMRRKRFFYEEYGVEEYYQYDPDENQLLVWIRRDNQLVPIEPEQNGSVRRFTSPRLTVRFEITEEALVIYNPDGSPFRDAVELNELYQEEKQRAEDERRKAEAERRKAEAERRKAEAERERAEKLAEKLRNLGIDPDTL
jgi:Uma2 family endonuclease